MNQSEQLIRLRGEVKSWQTDSETGEIVPETVKTDYNTIGTDMKTYLAQSLADDINHGMDNFISSNAYTVDKDGIAFKVSGASYHSEWFISSLNDGGDGTKTYTEIYGYIDGAVTLNGTLELGYALTGGASASEFTSTFATYIINETVPAARRFHFYWKITMS